jgi:hypothetical protein
MTASPSPLDSKSSLYFQLQNHSLKISEKKLAKVFEKVRYDARLMEVATEFIRDFWWNLDPHLLNRRMQISKFPFAIKPAISAILNSCSFSDKIRRHKFTAWCQIASRGIKNPPPQLFYIGLNNIGSNSMRREETEALDCFSSHGLIAKDLPFNKGIPGSVKTREDFPDRFDFKEILKSDLSLKIKLFKSQNGLNSIETMKALRINRTFLSKILGNNLEGITLDYLAAKAQAAIGPKG